MTCCGGKGVIRIRYRDGGPDAFGVCLCAAGLRLRDDRNAGRHTGYPLWNVWAAQRGIDFDAVLMIEDLLDRVELIGMFPAAAPMDPPALKPGAIAEAMRTHKAKL